MGLFLLILALAGGTYYATRPSDDADDAPPTPYADLSLKALLDQIFAQKDINDRWSDPEYGGDFKKMRSEMEDSYDGGTTEDRLIVSLLAYAEARNVKGDFKEDASGKWEATWKKSSKPALSTKSSSLLDELSNRYEDRAAETEKDPTVRAMAEAMMKSERKAIDKAAAEAPSDEKPATKAELEAALAKFESTNVAMSCLNTDGNFAFTAKKIWDMNTYDEIADVAVELYGYALDVGFTDGGWARPSPCTSVWDAPSSEALGEIANLLANRAVEKAPSAKAADLLYQIMDARKKIEAAAKLPVPGEMPPAATPDEYVLPSYMKPEAYAVPTFPPEISYSSPGVFKESLPGDPGKMSPTEDVSGTSAGMSPYRTDIGDRLDYGPARVWS